MIWQQWYFIIAWAIAIPALIWTAGYTRSWKPIKNNIGWMIFTIYVLYSGGFFRGMFY